MRLVTRVVSDLRSSAGYLLNQLFIPFWSFVSLFCKKGSLPPIEDYRTGELGTIVDSFWNVHTVIGYQLDNVRTPYQSSQYLKWRFSIYPLFKEFMQLWGNHDNQVILDYGCGPANDLVGFLVYTGAKKVIGVDVSEKALRFASWRLALHNIDNARVELILIADSATTVPLEDNSIDYIYCEGVLHHTSTPERIIKEFHRVLKPDGQACIMVYNHDSIWLHLYVAYEQMILEGRYPGMDVYQAFTKTTDTEQCPISRCYRPQGFTEICERAGFKTEYVGGYFARFEPKLFRKSAQAALSDDRLGTEHKDFLRSLTLDQNGFPLYKGKHAGIGGVYRLKKAA